MSLTDAKAAPKLCDEQHTRPEGFTDVIQRNTVYRIARMEKRA